MNTSTTRQPAQDAPDVLYNQQTGLFVAYCAGTPLQSFAHSQDAWAAARAAFFAPEIEQPSDAYLCGFEVGKRDAIKNIWRLLEATDTAPQIVAKRHICDDVRDTEHFGSVDWIDYSIGETEITIYSDATSEPDVFAFGRDGIGLSEVMRVLPALHALLVNPALVAARAAWLARQEGAK